MIIRKADIITQLRRDVLALQGFKTALGNTPIDAGLGLIKHAFPNSTFPIGAMHEFLCAGREDETATAGFIAGIVGSLMQNNGPCVWISSSQTLFPPALKTFGIDPDKIIFINLQKERDRLWAMEEALKCDCIAAVVGEIPELGFTVSRRFQLAAEQSRVTGLILRNNPRNLNITACVTRWKITPLNSVSTDDIPGVGFPRWNIELVKVRNGQPGNWQMEWVARRLRPITGITTKAEALQRKTG